MSYPDFDHAVKLCILAGKSAKAAKSDMSAAFRQVPLKPCQFYLLVMKAADPKTGNWFYFVDKCLPFRSSISCSIFQSISDAIAFVVSFRTGHPLLNYLDDYLFVAALRNECNRQVEIFLLVCGFIQFLVALEKTWATTLLTFLGLMLDSQSSHMYPDR